ncbi:hypothetical protein [Photobacterium sp. 53610]|uniref:hypothetical protein n=1 Tax=Photobacterium sp. 53610 TaxID=3102789 RepID=UPI002ED87BD8
MWDKVKQLIGTAAPMVGTLIGGPAGGAVGGLVASALGVDNTPDAIEHAIKNDPDAFLKLKQIEMEHAQELKRLSLEEGRLAMESARIAMADTQHAREQHRDHWMPSALAISMVGMVALMFTALLFGPPMPERYDSVLMIIVGAVLTAFSTAIAYWLGSSKGSVDKTKHLKTGG